MPHSTSEYSDSEQQPCSNTALQWLCGYLEAYGDHSPTDLLSHHELLAQHGQDDVLPEPTRQTLTQPDDPLPPTAVRLVLHR